MQKIDKILEFLHHNVSSENPHLLLSPFLTNYPLICSWNEEATQAEIEDFEKRNNWIFPADYKHFLKIHNGGKLFYNADYGGGIELFSLSQISYVVPQYEQLPKHCYPIAWTDHIAGSICIDSERYLAKNVPYLFFLNAIDNMEQAVFFNFSFTEWLEKLVLCQGNEYWNM